MTEDQIERAVERMFDALDRQFMRDGSPMTQREYDTRATNIHAWATEQYVKPACLRTLPWEQDR